MLENKSGLKPLEFNVVLKQDDVQEKTKGGLLLAHETVERDWHSQTRGMIVAVSPLAFNEDVFPAGMDKPKPGDRVVFAKHAGTFTEGADGEKYRVVKDKDIVAVLA